ncbi:hypothetical protein HYE67_000787 [Fusarium culmorum]|uniref:Uncharacterized protein n=1 Tax=Fusarium culmorum TaxID=5516 RepID=A0A7S8HRA5_FUSCU|nr:hypothetical protein HYE67_000787 [Fusarium culmorum]
MGPVVGSNTDKVSDEAGGPTYLLCKHNISPNHNHLSRRGCPPLYVLAAGRLDDNAGEETYQHLIWTQTTSSEAIVLGSKVILCSAGEKRGNEAAVQKTGRSTCTYCICWGPATAENQALCTAENFANTVIQLPSNNLDTERHSLQLQACELKFRDDLTVRPDPPRSSASKITMDQAPSLLFLPTVGWRLLLLAFVGCSGEVVFDPSTPAVAVAETDQLDSVSFATPEGVEHNGDGVRKASLMVPRWSADDACHKWWWWWWSR